MVYSYQTSRLSPSGKSGQKEPCALMCSLSVTYTSLGALNPDLQLQVSVSH